MDELFGEGNAGPVINYKTTAGLSSDFLAGSTDHLLWYFKNRSAAKFRRLYNKKVAGEEGATQFNLTQSPDGIRFQRFEEGRDEELLSKGWVRFAHDNLTSTGFATTTNYALHFHGRTFQLPAGNLRWKSPSRWHAAPLRGEPRNGRRKYSPVSATTRRFPDLPFGRSLDGYRSFGLL